MKNNIPISKLPSINTTDIIAGLSIAGLLLPEAVAYSSIANLPPQAGLIGLFAGLLCYGIFGTSKFAIVSATSSSAVLLAASTATLSNGDTVARINMSIVLVLLSGLFFLIAALAKLGSITDFISKPVLRGFAFGLAIIIIVKQFATIVGIHLNQNELFSIIIHLISTIKTWNIYSIGMGGISLVLLFVLSKVKYIPGGLIVIIIGILISFFIDLSHFNIALVGNINLQLDKPSIPVFSREEWLRLGEMSFAIAMILYSESYGSIRNFAIKHSEEISPNRDLFALGIANIFSGLFHGTPVGAGYSATSANEAAGATSRWAGLVALGVISIIVFTLLPTIALIPHPILATVVIHAVSHSLRLSVFRTCFVWKRDRIVVIAAIIGVLGFGVLEGLLVAILISLIMMLKRMADAKISILGRLGNSHDFVNVARYPMAKPIEGMIIFRPEQPLFFANCDRILNQARRFILENNDKTHAIVLSLEESPDIDCSTAESLKDLFTFIAQQNKIIMLARLKQPVYDLLNEISRNQTSIVYLSRFSVDDTISSCELIPTKTSV